MNIVVLPLLLMAAGTATEYRQNPVLIELITQGVQMPEGTVIKLPPPLLGKEMDAAAQRAAIERILPRHCTFEDFTARNSQAPLALKNQPRDEKGYTLRTLHVYFVARGRWNVLSSKEFGDTILKKKKEEAKKDAGSSMTAGFLTDKEMAKRKLKSVTEKHWGDRYFYSTFCLFDMVEVSATRLRGPQRDARRRGDCRPHRPPVRQGQGLSQPVAADRQGRPGQTRAGTEAALCGHGLLREGHPAEGARRPSSSRSTRRSTSPRGGSTGRRRWRSWPRSSTSR